jgi:hypothetical protein
MTLTSLYHKNFLEVEMKLREVEPKTIRKLAKIYVTVPNASFQSIGKMYGLSERMISNILWRGIAENIVPTNIADAIYSKVIKAFKANEKQCMARWDEAFEKREKLRKKLAEDLSLCLKLHQMMLFCLENYSHYSKQVASPISRETLSVRLENVNKRISFYQLALS